MKFLSQKRKLEAEIKRLRHRKDKEERYKKERQELDRLRKERDTLRRQISDKRK